MVQNFEGRKFWVAKFLTIKDRQIHAYCAHIALLVVHTYL